MQDMNRHSTSDRRHNLWALRTTALALGSAIALLAGCGGSGGGSTTPPSTLEAPGNFSVRDGTLSWTGVASATRYELFIDPDGAGPLPEAPSTAAHAFSYWANTNTPSQFYGLINFYDHVKDLVNATYRLRACNDTECGAFTAALTRNLAEEISRSFASGESPLSISEYRALSRDSLTMLYSPYVFARSATGQPWQLQATLPVTSGIMSARPVVLSADGNTVAAGGLYFTNKDEIQIYHRDNGTWSLQAAIAKDQTPPSCPQPCTIGTSGDSIALSADGNVMAVNARDKNSSNSDNAIVTYHRTGSTWTPLGYVSPGTVRAGYVSALSADGTTLAVNDDTFFNDPPPPPPQTARVAAPRLHIYRQNGDGVWTEQASLPAGVVDYLDIRAVGQYSRVSMSLDGKTLALKAVNVPGKQPSAYDLHRSDLSCDNGQSWNEDGNQNYYSASVHIALFTLNGNVWNRSAVIARGDMPWALAPDGSSLYYGGEVFKNNGTTWACP